MFEIVTVPSFLVSELPNGDLTDIDFYFDPDIYLVPDATDPDIPKHLAYTVGKRVVAPRLLAEPTPYYFDTETLLVIPYLDTLSGITNASFDESVSILTGFLDQDYDFSTFDHSITNIRAYRDAIQTITAPAIRHFTIEIPAGNAINARQLSNPIRGINWVEGQSQNPTRYIPKTTITASGDVQTEHLRSDRLGVQAIYQLGSQYRNRLESHGYTTREDISESDPEDILRVPGVGGYNAAAFISGARAIQDDTLYRFDTVPFTDSKKVFIDIETDGLQPEVIWQIGIYNASTDQYASLIQTDPERKSDIITAFGDWLINTNADVLLAWNGNNFDFPHLESFITKYGTDDHLSAWNSIKKADMKTDVVQKCGAVPSRTWTLSAIAAHVGFNWSNGELTGADAAERYTEWMHGGAEPDWDAWQEYCRDDVMAMHHIYNRLKTAEKIIDRDQIDTQHAQTGTNSVVEFSSTADTKTTGQNLTLDEFAATTPAEGTTPNNQEETQ
ncbi:ribonuclease H-like domain-containing protein [Salinibaculum rarum]|uniref:ribonuclease H-like domain-containing protein n=1 Tax=Salinibaculum rarum TaxID=3058903 RepID=UPI00265FB5B5|nr:ribonuclease H-like domain-containing protein [Salinibaculum sp. KK48]